MDGLDDEVGEQHVLAGGGVAAVDADAAVRTADGGIGKHDAAEIDVGFQPEAEGDAVRFEHATGDDDVFAGSVAGGGDLAPALYADGVVAGLDVAVRDPHGAAAIDVDAVGIHQSEVVEDGDALDEDAVAAGGAKSPGRRIDDADTADDDVAASEENDGLGARVAGFGVGGQALGDEGGGVAVEGAGAVDGHLVGIVGEEPEAAEVGVTEERQVVVVDVVGDVGRGDEPRARLQVQPHAGAEQEGAAHKGEAGGHDDGAAAGGVGGIDGALEGGRGVDRKVGGGAVGEDVVAGVHGEMSGLTASKTEADGSVSGERRRRCAPTTTVSPSSVATGWLPAAERLRTR